MLYAKIAYEKFFMRKLRTGTSEPIYEKYILKALGIVRVVKHGQAASEYRPQPKP